MHISRTALAIIAVAVSLTAAASANATGLPASLARPGSLQPPAGVPATVTLQTESYSRASGITVVSSRDSSGSKSVKGSAGDWARFDNVDLGAGVTALAARIAVSPSAPAGSILVRTGTRTGAVVGQIPMVRTGGWTIWQTVNVTLSKALIGRQTLYMTFNGDVGGSDVGNINWISFSGAEQVVPTPVPVPSASSTSGSAAPAGGEVGTPVTVAPSVAVSSTPVAVAPSGAAPGTGGTAGFPTSRDARLWPFRADSIWNMPRGASATLIPAGLGATGNIYADDDVVIMAPDAPLTPVYTNYKDWSDPTPGARCAAEGPLITNLPIPTALVLPDEGKTPNMSAAVLLADGRTIYQTQPMHRCVAGSYATSHYAFQSDDIITGTGQYGAHGGSNLSSLGGTIRVGELRPGTTIRHALKLAIDAGRFIAYNNDGTRGYRWPAAVADGYAASRYAGSISALEMGALLVLPADFPVDALSSEPGRIIARALRDYGAYVADDSYWDAAGIMVEWGNAGRLVDQFRTDYGYNFAGPIGTTPFLSDLGKILPKLVIVADNSPTTIGGTGTRMAPLAPPFT